MAQDNPTFPDEVQIDLQAATLTSTGCLNPGNAIDNDPATFAQFANQATVHIPALPSGAVTLDLQRSTDNSTFTTLQTGVTPGGTFQDTTRAPGQLYWYRVGAVNNAGVTVGPSVQG